jgi:hypothetical protein
MKPPQDSEIVWSTLWLDAGNGSARWCGSRLFLCRHNSAVLQSSCSHISALSLFAKSVNLQLLVRSKSGIVNYLIHSNYK